MCNDDTRLPCRNVSESKSNNFGIVYMSDCGNIQLDIAALLFFSVRRFFCFVSEPVFEIIFIDDYVCVFTGIIS